MNRGFEVVSRYQNAGLTLPQRATQHAAGYDFCAAEDFVLPSIWKLNFVKIFKTLREQKPLTDQDYEDANHVLKPYLVPKCERLGFCDEDKTCGRMPQQTK